MAVAVLSAAMSSQRKPRPARPESRDQSAAARRYTSIALAARFTGLGWLIAVELVAPTILGLWLDGVWDTRPIMTLAGLGLGTLLVPLSVWQYLRVAFKIG